MELAKKKIVSEESELPTKLHFSLNEIEAHLISVFIKIYRINRNSLKLDFCVKTFSETLFPKLRKIT